MPGIRLSAIRGVIAARRVHRYANSRPWIIFNSFLSNVYDIVDLSRALSSRRPSIYADNAFFRIVRRHSADVQVYDKTAISANFQTTLLQLATIKVLRVLYPRCVNIYNLRYLDFIYLLAAQSLGKSILDVTWNNPELLKDMCSLSSACIILGLHNGFAHTARTVSFSDKKIAAVSRWDLLAFYQINKVRNPQDIEIVPVNQYTLLTLAKIAKQNKAIICTPDYPNSETGTFDFISLGMFKLAEYSQIPLYFVDYLMDERGILRGFIKGPIENKAAESVAEDFLSFCRSISGRDLLLLPVAARRAVTSGK